MNQFAKRVIVALALCLVVVQTVAIAQNLGAAPQSNVAVQGQTGAQPEGAFLNFVNWVGNVIAPVGAGVAVLGGIVSYASGRGYGRRADDYGQWTDVPCAAIPFSAGQSAGS